MTKKTVKPKAPKSEKPISQVCKASEVGHKSCPCKDCWAARGQY